MLSGVFAMRIYDEPYRVNDILKGCKVVPGQEMVKGEFREGPIVHGVDLGLLNRKIAKIPVQSVRRQRHTFTLFFEECLVSADKEAGVSFESVLLILAHYRIINDNKSLR